METKAPPKWVQRWNWFHRKVYGPTIGKRRFKRYLRERLVMKLDEELDIGYLGGDLMECQNEHCTNVATERIPVGVFANDFDITSTPDVEIQYIYRCVNCLKREYPYSEKG